MYKDSLFGFLRWNNGSAQRWIKVPPGLILLVFLFSCSISGFAQKDLLAEYADIPKEELSQNKIIPPEIKEITLAALSHFPELLGVNIDFHFKNKIRGSVMQAQPRLGSLFINNKANRVYRVKISRHLELLDEMKPIESLPQDVLLGWIAHELGHVRDYIERSAVNMMAFGVRYLLSESFKTQAELAADHYTISAGLAEPLIATKDFILTHDRLPDEYKERISRRYMSPGEVLSHVEVEEEDLDEEN